MSAERNKYEFYRNYLLIIKQFLYTCRKLCIVTPGLQAQPVVTLSHSPCHVTHGRTVMHDAAEIVRYISRHQSVQGLYKVTETSLGNGMRVDVHMIVSIPSSVLMYHTDSVSYLVCWGTCL